MTNDYQDLDQKELSFPTTNRPARRYFYFRHIMAVMQAQKEKNPLLNNLPQGNIWASPEKKNGYLRHSTLRLLARQVGDQDLPEELVSAGPFVDTEPETGSWFRDQIAAWQVGLMVREKITGKGEVEEEESDDEEDD